MAGSQVNSLPLSVLEVPTVIPKLTLSHATIQGIDMPNLRNEPLAFQSLIQAGVHFSICIERTKLQDSLLERGAVDQVECNEETLLLLWMLC